MKKSTYIIIGILIAGTLASFLIPMFANMGQKLTLYYLKPTDLNDRENLETISLSPFSKLSFSYDHWNFEWNEMGDDIDYLNIYIKGVDSLSQPRLLVEKDWMKIMKVNEENDSVTISLDPEDFYKEHPNDAMHIVNGSQILMEVPGKMLKYVKSGCREVSFTMTGLNADTLLSKGINKLYLNDCRISHLEATCRHYGSLISLSETPLRTLTPNIGEQWFTLKETSSPVDTLILAPEENGTVAIDSARVAVIKYFPDGGETALRLGNRQRNIQFE